MICNPLSPEVAAREDVTMSDNPLFFLGPDGKQISVAQLPPRGFRHFQPRHKAMIVAAVRHGLMSVGEVFRRYNLSAESYLCWYRCYAPQRPEDAWTLTRNGEPFGR